MTDLIDIIRTECVPNRNCMLTVFDHYGESGFLYFKDAQLIEVNTGKLWGNHALGEVFKWRLSSYTLGELPIGIKRSLWDPLDKLIEQFAGEGAAAGLMDLLRDLPDGATGPIPTLRLHETSPLAPLAERIQAVPGFLALFQEEQGSLVKLAGRTPVAAMTPEWFDDFYAKTAVMSDSLGSGLLLEWFLDLEVCRLWKIQRGLYHLIVISDLESDADEFEETCRTLVAEVVQ
ncbi:MAG: hypothetical protein HC904_11770 [Blastochloris sp.]|nr:hypothetical protein [Blastochloris sp.]